MLLGVGALVILVILVIPEETDREEREEREVLILFQSLKLPLDLPDKQGLPPQGPEPQVTPEIQTHRLFFVFLFLVAVVALEVMAVHQALLETMVLRELLIILYAHTPQFHPSRSLLTW